MEKTALTSGGGGVPELRHFLLSRGINPSPRGEGFPKEVRRIHVHSAEDNPPLDDEGKIPQLSSPYR